LDDEVGGNVRELGSPLFPARTRSGAAIKLRLYAKSATISMFSPKSGTRLRFYCVLKSVRGYDALQNHKLQLKSEH
jgi:hypothetical protein